MLYTVYTLAFLCMLRFNEVLRIEAHHIEVINLTRETGEIKLTLPFRKTHQTGGKLLALSASEISRNRLS
jgi:hypothetical protein